MNTVQKPLPLRFGARPDGRYGDHWIAAAWLSPAAWAFWFPPISILAPGGLVESATVGPQWPPRPAVRSPSRRSSQP